MVRTRLDHVDLLRGLVMVVMALDHVRDYFMPRPYQPENLAHASAALFMTRWVTHFCAPVFIFLAGSGAFLYGKRCTSRSQLAGFLATRGLWLVFLDVFVVRCFWMLNFDFTFLVGTVLWAIGCSMLCLAVLVFLPLRVLVGVGLVMIVGHNALDGVTPADCGSFGPVWAVLHTRDMVTLPGGVNFLPAYPLIPWIGVMAVGYGYGAILGFERSRRRPVTFLLGLLLTAAFFALRLPNLYGDPRPWSAEHNALLSVLNCSKYPPSLLYLLMTLGPALLLLAVLDREPGAVGRFFIVYGRVPLFYYVSHLPLIVGLAALYAYLQFGREVLTWGPANQPTFGDLPTVYAVWLGVVLLLYPVCAWYCRFKQRHRSAWLSYL
jgi:uncharacterized membrane protein